MRKIVSALMLLMVVGLCRPYETLAQENHTFQVVIAPQFNHDPQTKSYYDITAAPSEALVLPFKIENSGSVESEFDISFNPALTNSAGSIAYSGVAESKIIAGAPVITEYGMLSEEKIKVPAGESQVITLHLTMPNEKFSGKLAGGIRVSQVPTGETTGNIRHTFSREIAVILQNEIASIKPDLRFLKAEIGGEARRKYVQVDMENLAPAYLSRGELNYRIRREKKEMAVGTVNLRLSPSTAFVYHIPLGEESFPAGIYELDLSATDHNSQKTWENTLSFEIDPAASRAINQVNQTKEELPLLIVVLGAIIVVLIGVIITILMKKRREPKK